MSAAQMMCRTCGLSPGLCDCAPVLSDARTRASEHAPAHARGAAGQRSVQHAAATQEHTSTPKRNGAETRLPTPLPPVSKVPGRVDPVTLPRDSSASDAGVERRVLGALLLYPDGLEKVRSQIGAEVFGLPLHRTIFGGMCRLADAGERIGLVTLARACPGVHPAEIGRLDEEPTPAFLLTDVEKLKKLALRRKLAAVGDELRDFDHTTPVEELREHARRGLAEIAETRAPGEKTPLALAVANSSVARFRSVPAAREWVVEGLIPARQTGMLVAAGGTGKGHWIQQLGCALSSALPFGPFRVPRRAGVLYLSLEDDSNELHLRFDAAKAAFWPSGMGEEETRDVERYFHQVDLVGLGARMGSDLVELIAAKIAEIPDCALVIIDPLTLAAPEMSEGMNDQKGAQHIHAAMNEIRHRCGVSVMVAHHTSKHADAMDQNAATGSKQLVDLSRFVINLSILSPEKVTERGLDLHEQYIEAATTKINAAARMSESAIWRRTGGGALVWTHTRRKADLAREKTLDVLREIQPATEATWERATCELDVPRSAFRAAKSALLAAGLVRKIAGERGRKPTKDTYEVAS